VADADSDGVADEGELLALEEAGVAGLNSGFARQNVTDANGNQHKRAGSFIREDGAIGGMPFPPAFPRPRRAEKRMTLVFFELPLTVRRIAV
jgi:hypothetical protein